MLARLASIAAVGTAMLALFIATARVWRIAALQHFAFAISAALFLALLTPFIIIAIRHQIRRERLKQIDLFAETFSKDPVDDPNKQESAQGNQLKQNASFEFVRAKYLADLNGESLYKERSIEQVPYFPMMLHSDWMLFFCAIPYMILSGLGMFILFSPADVWQAGGVMKDWIPASIFAVGGAKELDAAGLAALHVNVLTVAGMAFAGAYFYTLRLFLRAVTVFDLSPATFLRAFGHMVLSVTLAVVLYRVLPSGAALFGAFDEACPKTCPTDEKTAAQGIDLIWLALGFGFGFVPESALDHILRFAKMTYKRRYTKIEEHSQVVPLTILDGIDPYVAFRLEEANIYDVQNLATYNPIMLHIEGPYGIYQTIDWVAQAQLCNVVGADRFLMLKAFNIRTVFDLQQAVFAEKADAQIIAEVGRLLITPTQRDQKMRLALCQEGQTPAAPQTLGIDAVKQLSEVILDDLHVHRLRQLWIEIIGRVGKRRLEDAMEPLEWAAKKA